MILYKLEVTHNAGGDDEKEEIVNPPLDCFGPLIKRASDEKRDDVLRQQDKPNHAKRVRKNIALEASRQWPEQDPHGYSGQADEHKGTNVVPVNIFVIALVVKFFQVNISPTFQAILDGESHAENQPE